MRRRMPEGRLASPSSEILAASPECAQTRHDLLDLHQCSVFDSTATGRVAEAKR